MGHYGGKTPKTGRFSSSTVKTSRQDRRAGAVGAAHVRPADQQRPNDRQRALCPEGAPWRAPTVVWSYYECRGNGIRAIHHVLPERLHQPRQSNIHQTILAYSSTFGLAQKGRYVRLRIPKDGSSMTIFSSSTASFNKREALAAFWSAIPNLFRNVALVILRRET